MAAASSLFSGRWWHVLGIAIVRIEHILAHDSERPIAIAGWNYISGIAPIFKRRRNALADQICQDSPIAPDGVDLLYGSSFE